MALAVRCNPMKFLNYAQCVRARLIMSSVKERIMDRTFLQAKITQSFSQRMYSVENIIDEEKPNPKKKKIFIPRVTLLSETNEMSIVTLEVAQKMATRRNLKLVKIIDYDTKTERPTYRLMTSKEFIQEGLEVKKQKKEQSKTNLKGEKLLSMSTKISDHDLSTKVKSITKLLIKKFEIRILISYEGNKEKAEEISNTIERGLKELAPIITKVSSNHSLKIYVRPGLQANQSDDQVDSMNDKKENVQT
ncbi:translation initiation factor IF-3 [Venturia canescens]|uniref:translation initiation factor IF-3 n=1 Tax=Venturia canescens TaxID=32260 RepID=UPI001C9C1E24|nr:translation initiation factor IF-3 [Venturia canescens]